MWDDRDKRKDLLAKHQTQKGHRHFFEVFGKVDAMQAIGFIFLSSPRYKRKHEQE